MSVTPHQKAVAETCSKAAEADTMTFPVIVKTLMDAGFEGYLTDLRRNVKIYYLPAGDSVEVRSHDDALAVAADFTSSRINCAVREAQLQAPGYSYKGFCRKVAAAGCAGYTVSFLGRRALYFGRTGETHTEHFSPTN